MAPYDEFVNLQKALTAIHDQLPMPFPSNELINSSGGKLADVSRDRIIVRQPISGDGANKHFLMSGGLYQFLDYCPGDDCIAAEFTRAGKLVHA